MEETKVEIEFLVLSSFLTIIKNNYKTIFFTTFVFLLIGIVYAKNAPQEYIATGKIMPEVQYKASNGMGGINEMLKKYNNNIDLYNTEITSPYLYSDIIKTNDFYKCILSKDVSTKSGKKMLFAAYFNFNLDHDDRIKYYNIVQNLQKRIVITFDKRNNLIFVSAKMEDPVVAADIANLTITYIINYITQYRTEKSRKQLLNIESLVKEVSQDSSISEELRKEFHNTLLASKIQMKIKIQEDTPIIQVLEMAQIPAVSSNVSILNIIIGLTFTGLIIGMFILLMKNRTIK